MGRLGRLREVASANVCWRLALETSPIKVRELFSVIFFVFLRIVMICANNVFRGLRLRFLRFCDPDNKWQMGLFNVHVTRTVE